jgi:hypothetical protein
MSTDEQRHSAALHGEALLAAQSEAFCPVFSSAWLLLQDGQTQAGRSRPLSQFSGRATIAHHPAAQSAAADIAESGSN